MIFPEDYQKGDTPKDYTVWVPIIILFILFIGALIDKF